MLVGSLLGAGIASSVLSDINVDIADIINFTEQQTLTINTLSHGLVTTCKLITELSFGNKFIKKSLTDTNKYIAENLKGLAVANHISQKSLPQLIQVTRRRMYPCKTHVSKNRDCPVSTLFYKIWNRKSGLHYSTVPKANPLVRT